MSSDEESIRALEGLMNEFFCGTTTNERKRQIEQLLNDFSQQKDAWKHCLYYLTNTTNEYVMMYCCTVVDTIINRQWIGFPVESKLTIRSFISKFLLAEHKQVPHFIRNKLCKLIVDIGRIDWPHFYPEFLSDTLHLVQQPDTTILGLTLLQTASEEFACPRDDLSTARKEELRHLLLEQVPNILNILAGILEVNLDKSRLVVTATPPPSPTHYTNDQSVDPSQNLFSSSPLHNGNLLNSMFKSLNSNNKGLFKRCPEVISKECYELCTLALSCVSHFFSWIPLSDYITPNLLSTVFYLASFGCHSPKDNEASSSSHASIGMLAMCCINEIMSKNCVPVHFEDFLLQMFQYTFHLLQSLTNAGHSVDHKLNPANMLSELDECYLAKFTEFLRLFVSVHFRRFESNKQFPVVEFLSLLFKYTFQQPTIEGFINCLDIWDVFIDYIITKKENRVEDVQETLEKCHFVLVSLIEQLVHKFLFGFNQAQLDQFDDNEIDWQQFLCHCIETIVRISDLLPMAAYVYILKHFEQNAEQFMAVSKIMANSPSNEQICKLHCVLRDLSSTMQALGQLSRLFEGANFKSQMDTCKSIIEGLYAIVEYSCVISSSVRNVALGKSLQAGFVDVHAQGLAALKAYRHWLASYYHSTHEVHATRMIQSFVQSAISVIHQQVASKVSHSAAHLLMSITLTVRPVFLLELPAIQSLFNIDKLTHLAIDTQLLIYRSISNILLDVTTSTDQSKQTVSKNMYSKFIASITCVFPRIRSRASFADDKAAQQAETGALKWTLTVLCDLIENHKNCIKLIKQFIYENIAEYVNDCLVLFSIYTYSNDVTEQILPFFQTLFNCLRVQMGVQFCERIITNLMEIFSRDELIENMLRGDNSGAAVIEKFLNMLQLIIEEPGSAFKMFLPSTIKLCINQIYPIVAQRPSPDVKLPLFVLLHCILLDNWKYFFKSNILATLGQPGNETVQNQDEFISIMQAFGQSFLQPDINIFKQNLSALECLNSKWKLYHKTLFKEMMLNQFLKVLIQVLVHKSHDLLQEEIGISIYNMASVNFSGFNNLFIPQLLSECDQINVDQRNSLAKNFHPDTDLPTFMKNLHRFVSDLRHYELCNRSLPNGTITF